MLVVETVLGNVDEDPEWTRKYEARPQSEIERVVLDERERRRSRIRTSTDASTEIGIVIDGDHDLSPGDVLVDEDRLIVVTFENREALAVSFDGVGPSPGTLAEMAEFGYRVGNRHWDLAVRDEEILVALGTDTERKVREIEATLPSSARTRREMVDPTLFDGTPGNEGGGDSTEGHTHGTGGHTHDGSSHSHGHVGTHTHDHRSGSGGTSPDETRRPE